MKIHNFKILGLFAVVILALTACEEEGIDMQRGEGVVPAVTNLNPAVFQEAEGTYISFDIDAPGYIGDLIVLASVDGDKSRTPVKTISNFPANVSVSLAEVAAAKGKNADDFAVGQIFNFEVQTQLGERTYRSPASFNAPLACEYLTENVSGAYTAVSTGWGVSGPVTITADPEDPYTLYLSGLAALDGVNEDLGPLPLVVNPGNFHVSVPRTALASLIWLGYTNYSFGGTGILDTCTGEYNMTLTITVDQGSYGAYSFTFTPN